MNVTRDVIEDLLPVYFAGEASSDTKQLVEEFFRGDPDFARLAQRFSRFILERPTIQPAPHTEAAALARTKSAIRKRTWLIALAIFCTLAPMLLVFEDGRVIFSLWRASPALAMAFLAAAVGLWIAYYVTVRRLRRTML